MGMNKIMLTRLQPRFVELIQKYMKANEINQTELGNLVGLSHTRISNLITRGVDGCYRRGLSANYLMKFIYRGIIMKDELYDGKFDSPREKEFWDIVQVIETTELQRKIAKAFNGSLTPEALGKYLDSHIVELNGNGKK